MMPKILRGRPAAESVAASPVLPAAIGPGVLSLTDREMSRQFEAEEAVFFSDAFEDIARLAGSWWQYHHDKRVWARVTLTDRASYLDERRPECVQSDQNHARRRELRRADRANPDTGERDDS